MLVLETLVHTPLVTDVIVLPQDIAKAMPALQINGFIEQEGALLLFLPFL